MSSIIIDISVSRVKDGQSIKIVCPYCPKRSSTFDGFRKHLTRYHKEELGYSDVYKQASKLWRLYKEAKA